MAQTSLPSGNVNTGSWTPTPLWPRLAAGEAVFSNPYVVGDSFTVQLTPVAWPAPGTFTVTVCLAQLGGGPGQALLVLLQSGTLIAYKIVNLTGTVTSYVITPTPAQVALITDYTALQVTVTLIGTVLVPDCCSNPIPSVLEAAFSGGTGAGTCLNGLVVPLSTFTIYGFSACGQTNNMSIACVPDSGGVWALGSDTLAILANCDPGPSCSPFNLTFTGVAMSLPGGRTGTINVSVTG